MDCFSVHMSDEVSSFQSGFMCRSTVFYILIDRHKTYDDDLFFFIYRTSAKIVLPKWTKTAFRVVLLLE